MSPTIRTVLVGAAVTVLLTGGSLLGIALTAPGGPMPEPVTTACAVPRLVGTIVNVRLADMGAGIGAPMMGGGRMRIATDRSVVPAGTVSFAVANRGTVLHELVILPLPSGQAAGTRAGGPDSRVSEVGSLGEASANCAAGAGEGILPGGESWVTVTLPAGRYELICNYPGHYAAGMYAVLTVG